MGGAKSQHEKGKVTFIYPLSEPCNCNKQDEEQHGLKINPAKAPPLCFDCPHNGCPAAPLCCHVDGWGRERRSGGSVMYYTLPARPLPLR